MCCGVSTGNLCSVREKPGCACSILLRGKNRAVYTKFCLLYSLDRFRSRLFYPSNQGKLMFKLLKSHPIYAVIRIMKDIKLQFKHYLYTNRTHFIDCSVFTTRFRRLDRWWISCNKFQCYRTLVHSVRFSSTLLFGTA